MTLLGENPAQGALTKRRGQREIDKTVIRISHRPAGPPTLRALSHRNDGGHPLLGSRGSPKITNQVTQLLSESRLPGTRCLRGHLDGDGVELRIVTIPMAAHERTHLVVGRHTPSPDADQNYP